MYIPLGIVSPIERYLACLHRRPCDVIPRTPIVSALAAKLAGVSYASYAGDFRTLVQAGRACADRFSLDQVGCMADPYSETAAFGAKIQYIDDNALQCTAPLQDARDLGVLEPAAVSCSPQLQQRVSAAKAYCDREARDRSILGWVEGPFSEAALLRTSARFLDDLESAEGFACDLMDTCLQLAIDFAEAQVASGCDTIGIGEATLPLLDPQLYQWLVLPRHRKLVNAIREMGAYTRLHFCGDIARLLPYASELCPDIFDVDPAIPMRLARAQLGDRVTLVGNLDPMHDLMRGSAEFVRHRLHHAREQAGDPFMVAGGCELLPNTPVENVEALCTPLPW